MEYISVLVGGLLLFLIIGFIVKARGRTLQQKFVRLGTLKGKTKAEIIDAVGPPNAVSSLTAGKTLLQWMATSYHIALISDGDICEGVAHEFAV